MPPAPRWYDFLAPVTATVPCGGSEHHITWQRGKLVLDDHDLSAERAMIALGGQTCACMQVLKMWRDQLSMLPEMMRKTDWLGERAYLMPAGLHHPRQVSAYRNWERSWRKNGYMTRHTAIFRGDVAEQATPLLQHLAAERQGEPKLSTSLTGRGQGPTISGTVERGQVTITTCLDVAWLVRVAARGVGLVEGAFVVEVLEDGASSSLVRAARWKDGRLVIGTAHLSRGPEGTWSLAWTGEEESPEAATGPAPINIFDMDPAKLFDLGRARPRR